MKSQAILDQMILVVLNISLWQGRKALKMSDLALNGIDIDKLPPESLATLGSKRIISPKAVKIFISLKRAAKKFCLKNFCRYMWKKLRNGLRRINQSGHRLFVLQLNHRIT